MDKRVKQRSATFYSSSAGSDILTASTTVCDRGSKMRIIRGQGMDAESARDSVIPRYSGTRCVARVWYVQAL